MKNRTRHILAGTDSSKRWELSRWCSKRAGRVAHSWS